jgi:ABC-type sugar transport system ATPase subunit
MDEPSAALGVVQAARVVEVIRRLAGEGTAVILITHDIQQVLRVTDRILVLRHGSRAGEVETAQTTANEIVSLITGAHSQTEGY